MATTLRIAGQLQPGHKLKLNKSVLATVVLVKDLPGTNEVEIVTALHGRIRTLACAQLLEGNTQPTAAAGNDQAVGTGLVTLDGSGSASPDGDALTYVWTMTAKPNGSAAVLSNPYAVGPTFTADLTGTYTLSLTVTDSYGVASTADVMNVVVS